MLTLKPIDSDDPPDGLVLDVSMRGVTIYWRTSPVPTVKRRGRKKPGTRPSPWQAQRVGFHAVSSNGEDVPPRDVDEQARFVRAAYVLVACSHPIPSDAEVRYQVWW